MGPPVLSGNGIHVHVVCLPLLSGHRLVAPRRQGRGSSRRGGFTLLETVIAMGLLAFVFVSLPGLLMVLEQIESDTTLRTRALLCAQDKMEELKSRAAMGSLRSESDNEHIPRGPYERMRRSWEVRAAHGTPGLRHVTTECSASRKGTPIRQEIQTLMYIEE